MRCLLKSSSCFFLNISLLKSVGKYNQILFTMFYYTESNLSSSQSVIHQYEQDSSLERIKAIKKEMEEASYRQSKPFVVILGAGPAGLIRAIQSVYYGNPTRVLEKRSGESEGRQNIIRLEKENILMLKYIGAYQYLVERKLIYTPLCTDEYVSIRLSDLESALKFVLNEISDGVLQYETTVEKVDSLKEKINLTTNSKDRIENVDILVNTEGAHSSTNELLNIKRTVVVEKVPAFVAYYNVADSNVFFCEFCEKNCRRRNDCLFSRDLHL